MSSHTGMGLEGAMAVEFFKDFQAKVCRSRRCSIPQLSQRS